MLLNVVESVLLCVANMDVCLLLNCFQCDCRNAKIVTGGGSVELQVHEHAGEVKFTDPSISLFQFSCKSSHGSSVNCW
jgi:hypothetical protein